MSHRRCVAVLSVSAACVPLGLAASALAVTGSTAGLAALLPRAGEMPGFKAEGPARTLTSIAQDVAYDPPALRKADSENLIKDGFVVELVRNELGTTRARTNGTNGLTRLRSHGAAVSYDKFSFAVIAKPGPVAGSAAQVRFVRFPVPGVPGAMGVAEIARHKKASNANLQWVEGSCMIQVGDGTPSSTPLTAPLIAAAQAIYRRTKGGCTS